MELNEVVNKTKKIINRIVNSYRFVLIVSILILLKSFLFYNNTVAINENLHADTIIGTVSFIFIIACLIYALPNRARIITSILVNLVISIILFGDHVYYIFSNNVLSVAQISNLQYGDQIMSTLPMVIELKQIIYFLDIIIISLLFIFKFAKIEKSEKATKRVFFVRFISVIVGILIFFIIGIKYVEKGKEKSYKR